MKLRPSTKTGMRLAWILMMIPGFLRIPLPQADFHNIRHHHGVGEVCPHHDHLLRWHPMASQNDDVAIVHWHWILPRTGESSDSSDNAGGTPATPPRALLHAYHLDCLEPDWMGEPVIGPDYRGRFLQDTTSLQPIGHLVDFCHLDGGPCCRAACGSCRESGKLGSPCAGVLCFFQRWNC